MADELFEVDLTDGAALALHEEALGRIEEDYPWSSLDPARYPPLLVERARLGWTENALNEFTTAVALGQLIQAFGEARVPLDLWSLACRFPSQEVLHVELCARVAMRLGGGAPIHYAPSQLAFPLDPSLTPLERASELVVRLCCVGEAMSLPLLAGCLRSATNPLVRKVLETIVADERHHGRLGFLYLDWIGSELSPSERDRLGRAARETLDEYAPIWERLSSRCVDGVTSEGFRLTDVNDLGWMESSAYQALARDSIERCVRRPLGRHGIVV